MDLPWLDDDFGTESDSFATVDEDIDYDPPILPLSARMIVIAAIPMSVLSTMRFELIRTSCLF